MSSGQVSGILSVSEEESRVDPIQVARRCSKVFQILSASLVRVGDVQGVSRQHAVRGKKDHPLCRLLGVNFFLKYRVFTEKKFGNGDFHSKLEARMIHDPWIIRFLDRSHLIQAHSTHPRPRKFTTSLVDLWSSLL